LKNIVKNKLNSILGKITRIVNPIIEELLDFYVDKKTQKIVKYPIFTGGKKIRSALAAISCQLLGGKIEDVLYPAAGLEILHNYTLIIDDIIDNSILRRGKATAWVKFGRSIAQCVGADYAAATFEAANQSKKPLQVSRLFTKTIKIIVDGEILDILFEQRGRKDEPYVVKNRYQNIIENDYFEMASLKTANLFQTCCEIGGICAGAKEKELKVLRNYGFNLGIAFQITDDILDIFGKEKKFGKQIGKDILEGKRGNIVILYAQRELPQKKKKKFLKILRKEKIENKDIKEAVKLISQTHSRVKAYSLEEKFIKKAKENLNFLPKNKWNNLLEEIADFIIAREE